MNRFKIRNKYIIKESDIILIIIVAILIITYSFIKIFTIKSEPILLDYAKRKSNNIISILINKSINEVLINDNYENIIILDKDENGNIESLSFNNQIINEILYLSTDNLLNSINMLENNKYQEISSDYFSNKELIYYIPIGVIHNLSVLINIGPRIPFKIDILSSVNNEIFTNVKEYGINSSMIEIYLNINLQVQVILPFTSELFDINKQILLDSKIIQGKIPEYYGGLVTKSFN